MASEVWNGILVRGSLGETGTIPRASSSNSPDLIAFGTSPMADPNVLTDEGQYSEAFSNQIFQGNFNYLYTRGKNLTGGPVSGHWEFWAVPSNLILLPGLWKTDENTVRLQTSSGEIAPRFEAQFDDEIVASLDAFTWNVKPLSDGRHYCLIGVAVTDGHPNPIADQGKISDWGAILANNGNIAQRNTRLVVGDVPDITDSVPYSQGDEETDIEFAFVFSNMPLGSKFHVASGTPVPGEGIVELTIDPISQHDFTIGTKTFRMPAQWASNFNYSLIFGNDWGDVTGTPSVTLRPQIPMVSTHRHYRFGRVAGIDPRTRALRVDKAGRPIRLLTVGAYTSSAVDKQNPSLKAQ